MARGDPMIHVRVTDELKSQLEETAREAGRSINAEVVHRLLLSYRYESEREAAIAKAKREEEALFGEEDKEWEKIQEEMHEADMANEGAARRYESLMHLDGDLDTEDLLDLLKIRLERLQRQIYCQRKR
ncbi:Arc family DNA-binding protein [Asaia sp. VD9]|uniref:Arc family DNA-binding protein n=1 Tax=Asaia sp. VD9 TaxID=3081235 RepID=UPI00301669C1